jgi:hypothetical protein
MATTMAATEAKLSSLSADFDKLKTEVTTFKSELDTFYLMWAGARVDAVLAPLERHVVLTHVPPAPRRCTGLPDAGRLCHSERGQHPLEERQEHPSEEPAGREHPC